MKRTIPTVLAMLSLAAANAALVAQVTEGTAMRAYGEDGGDAVLAPAADADAIASALGLIAEEPQLISESGSSCSGGIKYDDGSFENGYGWSNVVFAGTYGMRFHLPASTNRINAICICWRTLGGSTHDYGLRIWAANGAGGAPGSLLQVLPAATAVASAAGTFVRYEIPGGLDVATQDIYVAPAWAASLFPSRYICADENGPGGSPAYAGTYSSTVNPDLRPIAKIGEPDIFPNYKALGIRVEAEASSACIPGPNTACLLSGRFKVEIEWTDFSAVTRDAYVASAGTSDSALFYWTNPNNWEVLIKAINACSLNNKFWIYFAAATNVGYRVTVTDTLSGGPPKVYTNPVGTLAQATNDINAFDCP